MKFTAHSKYVPNWQFQTETDVKSTFSLNLKVVLLGTWTQFDWLQTVPVSDECLAPSCGKYLEDSINKLWLIFRIDSALDWETSMINEGRSPNLAPSKPASCCPFLTESNVTNCVVGAENTFDKGCADYVSHVVPRPSVVPRLNLNS